MDIYLMWLMQMWAAVGVALRPTN